jgi:hypothetical protein
MRRIGIERGKGFDPHEPAILPFATPNHRHRRASRSTQLHRPSISGTA